MDRYVAVHARLSKAARDGRADSVPDQIKNGKRYAARVWPGVPVRVFSEGTKQATRDDIERPVLDDLRAAVARGEVVGLWTREQSRLERRRGQWPALAMEFEAGGLAEIHTDYEGIIRLDDEVGDIRAALSAAEVRKLKKRVNDRLASLAAEGRPAGGRSFGYRHVVAKDGTKALEIVPEQARAIHDAAGWLLSGWSLANVVRALDERGVKGGHGRPLSPTALRSALTSPTVAAQRVYRGEIVGRGNWEPILDEQTWRAVRAKLSTARQVSDRNGAVVRAGAAHRAPGRKYLLTGGLIVCGVCDAPMLGSVRKLKRGDVRYYLCHPVKGGKSCTAVLLAETERCVVDQLFAELDKPEFLDAIATDDSAEQRARLDVELQSVEEQRRELARMWAKRGQPGALTSAEWQAARDVLADTERQLQAELAAIPPPAARVDIGAARDLWTEFTLDEQREFVRLFAERVVVHRARRGARAFDPARIAVEWRGV